LSSTDNSIAAAEFMSSPHLSMASATVATVTLGAYTSSRLFMCEMTWSSGASHGS